VRFGAAVLGATLLIAVIALGVGAPEHLSDPQLDAVLASPLEQLPLGTDERGRPLIDYARQGAGIVAGPALLAGLLVALFSTLGGLAACISPRTEAVLAGLGEVVGALPRMVVILVVALVVPRESRSLWPIALTWALLATPGAMDEAAAVARRLGGARFVEALRAHGFSSPRILLVHLVGYNLRPVVVRQGLETMMQVVFLEIALSYLALADNQPSLTHSDSTRSWAAILDLGYKVILDLDAWHALWTGLGLLAMVAGAVVSLRFATRAR